MKKIICFFTIFVFWGITDSMAQGLHFGVKAGVLGNKANISGMRDQFKEESLTGFQVGPMLQYQTGFHGIALDFSLLYVERGIKLTNTSNIHSYMSKFASPVVLVYQKRKGRTDSQKQIKII